MKCSKCGYLGFNSSDRCRNCGYEFALAQAYDLPDLVIRRDDDEQQGFDDYALTGAGTAPKSDGLRAELESDFRRVTAAGPASAVMAEPRPAIRQAQSAMPLFAPDIDDDTPLITKASAPRAPLAVRRSTPEVARLRSAAARTASLDLGLEPEFRATAAEPRAFHEDAGVTRRVLAGAVDSIILLAIDAAVVYFTMQICGVGIGEFGLLPKGPLLVFLVAQNVGYLVAFTAGGQTLGKMAAGIEVIPEATGATLDLGCALKRTVMWLVLAFPAGLGLLSALVDGEHRGLHDRVAGTRVVRAAA
jgi:uncharacterized RDD family membrane protein YckC